MIYSCIYSVTCNYYYYTLMHTYWPTRAVTISVTSFSSDNEQE